MKKAFILLPNQLFKKLPPEMFAHILLVEDPRFFSEFNFHKKKLVFHRASMKACQQMLVKNKRQVTYLDHRSLQTSPDLGHKLSRLKIKVVGLYDPVDHVLSRRLTSALKNVGIKVELFSSPLFLSEETDVRAFFADKGHYSMNSFYIAQRKQLNLLLDHGKPRGGKWSFDRENRQKLPPDVTVPPLKPPQDSTFVREAKQYVNTHFAQYPGTTDDFFYPVTHRQASHWLTDFIEHRLEHFGPYEDAVSTRDCFLFHSLLSPLLNSGLLTPDEVLMRVMTYEQKQAIRFNSLEGFIRQIIGWREFVRAVYVLRGPEQQRANFWGFKLPLPPQFYQGTTGVEPVDLVIRRVQRNAYAHHIERLMILGNFMLLCEIHPQEVYRWFMELFIDAYEWVMVPNVFGMSQYADGGGITTKPYISSSAYIRKMSDVKAGPWCAVWDSLFWNFIVRRKNVFAQNPRMKMMAVQAERMPRQKMNACRQTAERFLNELHGG